MYDDFGRFFGAASTWPTLERSLAIVAIEGIIPPGKVSWMVAS
jgi:hypothetical protein